MAKLVVVESPSKAKTINKYLGSDYVVKASKGHVVDLPKSSLAVDVEHDFKPEYIVTNKKSLKELKDSFKNTKELILAVDLDREGEAIGWHVAQKLGVIDAKGKLKKGYDLKRITFHEISKNAIKEALDHPRSIDMNLVNAQQARRILDRLVGYKLSPVLWKKISFGLSAGRVQSAALRLIVEKEDERNKFKSDEFWEIETYSKNIKPSKINVVKKKVEDSIENLNMDNLANFAVSKVGGKVAKLALKTEAVAIKALTELEKEAMFKIANIDKSESVRNPKAPFTTSTFQQSAVNKFGMTSKRAMMAAQKLYERGFITYMRTDSVFMSNDAINDARKYIEKTFGGNYIPKDAKIYKQNSKLAQEAHECIRPVDLNNKLDNSFNDDEKKVYELIKARTLASQMNPARLENIAAIANVGEYELRANGVRVLFDGFLVLGVEKVTEKMLPDLKVGDELFFHTILGSQGFTKPPARYSEASLIKKLEELGIGRPSTYSSIISTILSRKYVEKEGKYLFPTDVGMVVNKLLVNEFPDVVDYQFTSEMEDNLDKIADGKLDYIQMLSKFYTPFEKVIKSKEKTITRDDYKILGEAPSDIKCPVCGSKMVIKLGKYGRFYSCIKFPDCDGMLGMDGKTEEDFEKEAKSDDFLATYLPAPKTEDGRDYLLKRGKFGNFWAHPDYPKVKDARPLELRPEKFRELYGEPPKTEDGRDYLIRKGRFGEFWAHPDYPKVKDIIRLKKKPSSED